MPINFNPYKIIIFLFLLSLCGLGIVIYLYWSNLFAFSQVLQREAHQQLTQFLTQVSKKPWQTGFLLTGLSLIYGILHAAGPGHGKFIITTYLATQPSQLKRSLYLTLFSALMQGVLAIALVTILLILFNFSTHQLTKSEYWLEFSSYIIVIAMGIAICYRAVRKLLQLNKQIKIKRDKPKIIQINPFRQDKQKRLQITEIPFFHKHDSSENSCDCGHRHLPTSDEISIKKHWYSDLAVILSIGMRPCSGALLVLLFSHVIGVYIWGMIATLAMSIGTAITTSFFALFVYFARQMAEKLAKQQFGQTLHKIQFLSYCVIIIGGILFIVVGLLLITGLNMQLPSNNNPLFR